MLPSEIKFTKLNSAGNDFICLDNTKGSFANLFDTPEQAVPFVKNMCRRGLSVGADGLIVANDVDDGDSNTIIARFFEPDGSEARLCGNGTACFTYWAIVRGLAPGPEVDVITRAGSAKGRYYGQNNSTEVQVCIPDPTDFNFQISLPVEDTTWQLSTVDIGVPHAVAFVKDIEKIDVEHWGRLIRHHPRFQPAGCNVNFVQTFEPGYLAIRTFEFGVEGETLACGTGSAAAAIIACLEKKWGDYYHECQKSIDVRTRSGDTLRIWFQLDMNNRVNNVCMISMVRPIYEATILPELHRLLL